MNRFIIPLLCTALFFSYSTFVFAAEITVTYKSDQPGRHKQFCIVTEIKDQKQRSDFEISFVQKLGSISHVSAFSSLQLFPPSRQWDQEMISSRLKKMNIDAILKFEYQKISGTSDTTKPNVLKASIIRPMDHVTEWEGLIGVDFESLSKEDFTTFTRFYTEVLVKALWDDSFIYDCHCGNNYDRLMK